jgi:enoyl-CoA hydratase/carnithine racemase
MRREGVPVDMAVGGEGEGGVGVEVVDDGVAEFQVPCRRDRRQVLHHEAHSHGLTAALDLDVANDLEAKAFGRLFGTKDTLEGMSAFLEKRPAAFKGE